MAEEKQNYTIFQRLGKLFQGSPGGNPISDPEPTYNFNKAELLRTQDKEEFERERLQAQQAYYLSNQWKRIDSELYQKAIWHEPNRMAGYYDYESMEFCLHGDTKIATPDGFITIKQLAEKGRDYEFITYAYDHNDKKVVPAMARNAHYTRDEMTYKVTFDDGTYIIATWDHRLMKRDGSFIKVSELKKGDSMMPFYRKSFYNNQNYNWVYTCNSDEGHHGWIAEHNLIAEWFNETKLKENEEVHHIDFNGKNNLPENLQIMDRSEHRSYHARLNNEKLWSNPEYVAKMKKVARRKGKMKWNGKRKGKNNPAYFHIPFDDIVETAKKIRTLKGTAKALNIAHTKLQREIMWAGYKDWTTFCDAYNIQKSKYSTAKVKGEKYALNHKVESIEEYGVVPVYDLTVPGYKNFATDTIFSHNTPEISAALDIYAEEATTLSEQGYMLNIFSESKRIKSILGDLFNNIMDIDTNLPMWTRNVCKFGDNFVYLKLDPKKGIIGVNQLPNIEIERVEKGLEAIGLHNKPSDKDEERETKFVWKEKNLEFNTWEVAHFRLLGDDRKLPYGTSMLEKARRIWKQLVLSEDAMLIYRTSRAPERRVFKVFVGNMDDDAVDQYVQKIANKFKRDNVVDPANGNIDQRYNQMAVDQDYFIPVRTPDAPNPIDTLPGAQNLSEIADIEYIQKKLLAALRIPKAFLGFEDVVGEGKQLSLLDIRFARTINRVQKAMIQELNKIAVIHLYILGLEDELNNFTLGLTNPSTQSDLLKVEAWKEKIMLYRDAVSDPGNGISPVSHTWAKKTILGMSDEEVKLDLQQQRLERALAKELEDTPNIIKKTGLFNTIDELYGTTDPNDDQNNDQENEDSPGGGSGGDFDFGGLGGGSDSSNDSGGDFDFGDTGGSDAGNPAGDDLGGDFDFGGDDQQEISEQNHSELSIILENKDYGKPKKLDLSRGQQKLNELYKQLSKLNLE